MEDEKKIREPFKPEDTPNPPQIIDPNNRNDEPEKEPVKAEKKSTPEQQQGRKNEKPGEGKEKEKLLGESETEITDETTI